MAVVLLVFALALLGTSMVTIVAAPTEWPRQLGPYWTSLIAIALVAVGLAISSGPSGRERVPTTGSRTSSIGS